jgi:ERCC4-type nuclease
MFIKIDSREGLLIQQIHYLIDTIINFKNLKIKVGPLPIGDVIICDDNEDKMIIERKSLVDLLASIKDGRYEEQSYRLHGCDLHNHNIMYLIEGYYDEVNKFKSENKNEKLTVYSAMTSLNYFKGFSVFRSFNIFETAYIICNIAYKLDKDKHKNPYYCNNQNNQNNINKNIREPLNNEITKLENEDKNLNLDNNNKILEDLLEENDFVSHIEEKNYVNVVKKVKKENITPENISEIMLSQIPGISSVTSIAILKKYKNISNLLKELQNNPDCLRDISILNNNGKLRKINKNCGEIIIKYLIN